MLFQNLENGPDIFGASWNIADDWKNLRSRAHSSRRKLQEIRENQKAPEILSPFSYLTEELVVNTLRSIELPETVYWTLHYFAESNRQYPVISTDRGKTVYIELDRLDDTITVYIGHTDELHLLSDEQGQKLYALNLIEKYEFVRYPLLGSVLKRRFSTESMQKWHKVETDRDDSTPFLFFTLTSGKDSSACVKFADRPSIMRRAFCNESTNQSRKSLADQTQVSSAKTVEIGGSKVLSVFAARSGGKSDKNFPPERAKAVLGA